MVKNIKYKINLRGLQPQMLFKNANVLSELSDVMVTNGETVTAIDRHHVTKIKTPDGRTGWILSFLIEPEEAPEPGALRFARRSRKNKSSLRKKKSLSRKKTSRKSRTKK